LTPDISEWVLWAILLLPVTSFGLITLYVRRFPAAAGYLTILAVGAAMILAFIALFNTIDADGNPAIHSHEWLTLGDLTINIGVRIDGLTAVMLIVVTSVSFLVQVYSVGYMHGDGGYARYFAYMSLFTAAMLGLVLADNILQIFVFWELVGLASYLLIGFWFHKPSAAAAAKKAFLVTRFGDLGFLMAVLLIWNETGTFQIDQIQELALAGAIGSTTLMLFALGLLSGAAGKSAQFPLHVWLPDAMEGPTTASALIHAATMVAAGVYLLARFFPIYEVSDDARWVVAGIGTTTAAIAALLALVQTDVKRVLAYSTISQLGYMVLAIGVLGYVAAIFHLFTHAFFKALLFLGSGSVNHATNTFDMRKMGGLREFMPITFATFVIGSLALAGIFPLSGFWSKDEILRDAWEEQKIIFVVALVVAFLTAFYMFRAIFLTFFGEYKGGEPADAHGAVAHGDAHASETAVTAAAHDEPGHHSGPHESPWVMAGPLIVLSIAAIGAGFANAWGDLGEFIHHALPDELQEVHELEFLVAIPIAAMVAALLGIGLAYVIYGAKRVSIESFRERPAVAPVQRVLENKYYLDYLYEDIIVRRLFYGGLNKGLALFDNRVVDGAVNLAGWSAKQASGVLRQGVTGQLQAYGFTFIAGTLFIVLVVLAANPF
jgi:NADH-quinone oxidoreductase subunit L